MKRTTLSGPVPPSVRRLVTAASILALVVLAAGTGGRGGQRPISPGPQAQATGGATAASTAWSEAERLIGEQKFAAALDAVDAIRRAAQAAGNEADWTRALVKEAQLRIALHGYETAVRFLREAPWPEGPLSRAVLDLVYAHALTRYLDVYSWEIRQREKVESRQLVDLKAWTAEQIVGEALHSFADAWSRREALGQAPIASWTAYLTPNTYPAGVRGTVRDTVSYLAVELLADTTSWRPEEENELYRLDLRELLDGGGGTFRTVALDDPTVHPLRRLAAVLADLEEWHAAAGQDAAALEARLERSRRLYAAFSRAEDRRAIVDGLERRLPAFRGIPWWAQGQAQLAEFLQQGEAPDTLIRARAVAQAGWQAYPDSVGGKHCRSIVGAIEAPDYGMQGMRNDGRGQRSFEITHRNIPNLYFRAYADDLTTRLERAQGFAPDPREIERLLSRGRPEAGWTVSLPPTPDYRTHRTFVTPPLAAPGTYIIVASARPGFGRRDNRLAGVPLLISNLVLVTRQDGSGGLEVRALAGDSGAPVAGATISLYRYDWRTHHRVVAEQNSDAQGLVVFPFREEWSDAGFFLMGSHGLDLTVDTTYLQLSRPPAVAERTASLLYTDRSIYRPTQKLLWKVLVYRSSAAAARFHTVAGTPVTVSLLDPNGQPVETRLVSTNEFGSAAGEFAIPAGRPLGVWRLTSSLSGESTVRVEEYKRPTFEVTLEDPRAPLRLNRPATLFGEARYYFGLPVTNGTVRWRVTREPVCPLWWGWWGWRPPSGGVETVAVGKSTLKGDGSFAVDFAPRADERLARSEREITYRYRLAVDVTDEGGETRSASRVFRLGFVSVEASIESDHAFFRTGVPAELTAVRTTLDGVPRPGEGRWRLVELRQPEAALLPAQQPVARAGGEEEPPPYRTPGDAQRPRWDSGLPNEASMRGWPDGAERARGEAHHDEAGRAVIGLGLLPPGVYRLRYETTDDYRARYEASKEFVVADAQVCLALPLVLEAEDSSVPVGGTARLLVASGLPGQTLFLDIYRAGLLRERKTLIAGRDPALIEIPVGEAERGGFGVSLTALRDHQFMSASQSIFVPWDDRKLSLSFASFRDTLRPGARETWRVTVRGQSGALEAGAAELLAYMYDKSLDIFAPHRPPDPLSLYPDRSGVGTCRASVGPSSGQWLEGADFSAPPSWQEPEGDRLQPLEEYGIGGPGRRGPVLFEAMALRGSATPPQAAMREGVSASEKLSAPAVPPPAPEAVPQLRGDFAETAFWQPQLLTGADGSVVIEFTVPDSVTAWNVWIHAITRDLRAGSLHREARSVKELMVRPYLPRFLREGDRAEIPVVVNNASNGELSGWLTLDVLEPATNASMLAEFGVSPTAARQPFTVGRGASSRVAFALEAPRRLGEVAFKVIATAGDFSDGELRPLPVLPSRLRLVQSRFVTLHNTDRRVMRFADLARNDDPTCVNEQMIVTVDAQLFSTVLAALPYLVNVPYECTEQTLNRFLSTGIVSSLYKDYPAVARLAADLAKRQTRLEIWEANDPNRTMRLEETPWLEAARGGKDAGFGLTDVLDPRIAKAEREASLAKLRKAQTASGAFPWWPGGPPSPYMTLYIMIGLARAAEFGVAVPKDMVARGWSYLAGIYRDELKNSMRKDCCWEFLMFLNYAATCYPDPSWMGDALTPAERREILDFSFKHWKEHSAYLKGMLALTLKRMDRPADAKLVWDSVMDSSQTNEEQGTFWAPEDRSWLWYNDTIESQAFALGVLLELDPHDPRRDGLVHWLFLNKKLNAWKSTRATAEVIYALVHYLQREGALAVPEEVSVAVGPQKATFTFDPAVFTGKGNRLMIAGDAIDPAASSTVVVGKQGKGFAFASATWRFSTDELPAAGRGDFFAVSRSYFKRVQGDRGFTLVPLTDGTPVRVGDEVEVHISLSSKHAAEYVHLRDPRAAGLEPESAVSSFKWDLGIGWYEEVRDSATNLFIERLPAGEYAFAIRLRVATAGTFRVGPATVQSMYAPEFNAYSAGALLTIMGGK